MMIILKRSQRVFRRIFCLLLAVLMAVSPSAAVFAQTNAAQQAVRQRVQGLGQTEQPEATPAPASEFPSAPSTPPTAAGGGIDASYVSPTAMVVIAMRPAQIMASPLTEMLPREVATAAGMSYLGFDPADVDEVVAFGEMANMAEMNYALAVKFNKPFKASSIPEQSRAHAQLSELNGKKYLQSPIPILPSLYGPRKQMLVVAPDETLRQLVGAQGQPLSGALLDRLRAAHAGSDVYVAVDVAALRPMLGMGLAMAGGQVPPDLQPLLGITNLISSAELTVNLTGPGPTSLVVNANDEAAAEQVLSLLNDASQKHLATLKAQFAEQAASEDPIQRALAAYSERVTAKSIADNMPTRDGNRVVLYHSDGLDESQKKMVAAGLGMAVSALLPAMQAGRQAAQRTASTNNMKQIMLAWHVYHDKHTAFPAHANYSDDGQPLLSWRVHILPFIDGGQELYAQFKLDEPWDSENNKALIAQMPAVFQHPDAKLEPGKTNYLALVGSDCILSGTKEGVGIRNITDGTSNTIAFVEADPAQAVEWTKPDDLEFNPDDPKAGLGNVRPGGWNAALSDGSVRFIPETIDAKTVKAFATIAGGEVADIPMAAPIPVGPPPPAAGPGEVQFVPGPR
jgi:hypothetical protein